MLGFVKEGKSNALSQFNITSFPPRSYKMLFPCDIGLSILCSWVARAALPCLMNSYQYWDSFFLLQTLDSEKLRFKGTSRGMYFHLLLGIGHL